MGTALYVCMVSQSVSTTNLYGLAPHFRMWEPSTYCIIFSPCFLPLLVISKRKSWPWLSHGQCYLNNQTSSSLPTFYFLRFLGLGYLMYWFLVNYGLIILKYINFGEWWNCQRCYCAHHTLETVTNRESTFSAWHLWFLLNLEKWCLYKRRKWRAKSS